MYNELVERLRAKSYTLEELSIILPKAADAIEKLTAEPKYSFDEWCTDCKEYDQKKHCCPRFNRVIRKTVEEVRQHLLPEQGWKKK